jgi:hypothetical protein
MSASLFDTPDVVARYASQVGQLVAAKAAGPAAAGIRRRKPGGLRTQVLPEDAQQSR